MANNIYPSTSSVRVDIRIYDPKDPDTIKIDWSSTSCPQYVVTMQHVMQANGNANDLSLTLYHHIDPYSAEGYGPSFTKDAFGDTNDDPSYLMLMLSRGYGTIHFRYGYVQDTQTKDESSFGNNGNPILTEWFKMYITDVSSTFDTNGITYEISAVSTLVNSEILLTGSAYNWATDVEDRLKLDLSDEVKPEDGSEADSTAFVNSPAVKSIIIGIIHYLADKTGYQLEFGDFEIDNEHTFLIANTRFTVSTFNQNADEDMITFINRLLGYIQIQKYHYGETFTYTGIDGTEMQVENYYSYYSDWKLQSIDSVDNEENKPTLKVTWSTETITKGSLTEYNTHDGEVNEKDYQILTTRLNGQNTDANLGALVYNYSTFNRDIFESITLSENNIYGKNSNFPSRVGGSQNVSADIISLNLNYPILAGIVGAYQGGGFTPEVNITTGGAASDENGDAVNISSVSGAYSNGVINSEKVLSALMAQTDNFKSIMNRIYVEGSVVIPGVAKIVTLLSRVNLYVYISNKLDLTSGKYLIMGQTDKITDGVYTTELGINKVETFDNKSVYNIGDSKTDSASLQNVSVTTFSVNGQVNPEWKVKKYKDDPNSTMYEGYTLPSTATSTMKTIYDFVKAEGLLGLRYSQAKGKRSPDKCPPEYLDCSAFVYHVFKYSNLCPDFPSLSSSGYNNSSYFVKLTESEAKSGDIVCTKGEGHVAIIVDKKGSNNKKDWVILNSRGEDNINTDEGVCFDDHNWMVDHYPDDPLIILRPKNLN